MYRVWKSIWWWLFKKKHELAKHNGKHVRVEHVGAPLNLFKASKRKAASSFTVNMDKQEESVEKQAKQDTLLMGQLPSGLSVVENQNKKYYQMGDFEHIFMIFFHISFKISYLKIQK